MKALIWKEVRELAVPAAVVVAIQALLALNGLRYPESSNGLRMLPSVFLLLVGPLLGLLAGCWALARERQWGTDILQGAMPVSRARIWSVKLVTALLVLALVYALLVGLTAIAHPEFLTDFLLEAEEFGVASLWLHIAITFFMFAMGFVLSGIRRHAFEAVLVAALSCLLLGLFWMFLTADVLPRFWGPQLGMLYTATPVTTPILLAVLLGGGLLIASGYGFIGAPPLAYGRRYWRTVALGTALFVVTVPLFFVGVRYLGEPGPEDIGQIDWASTSPDGERIVFADWFYPLGGISPTGEMRLWLMRGDGTSLRCLARGPVITSSWSGDSRQVGVIWGDHQAHFHFLPAKKLVWAWLLDLSTDQWTRLPVEYASDRYGVDFSPQGNYLEVENTFFRLKPRVEAISARLPDRAGVSASYDWASDDSRVYFSREDKDKPRVRGLWAMEMPGGKFVGPLARRPAGFSGPTILPGAEWIQWRHTEEIRKEGQDTEYVYRAILERLDGTARIELAGSPFANIRSRSLRYLWVRRDRAIEIVDLEQQRVIRKLSGEAWEGHPIVLIHWSQDGKKAAFHTQRRPASEEESAGPLQLWAANADGSQLRHLAEGSGASNEFVIGGWTADGGVVVVRDHKEIVSLDAETGEETILLRSEKGWLKR